MIGLTLGSTFDAMASLAALTRSHAVIEYGLDGTILTANENFLGMMGYSLPEILGKHHSIFVDPACRDSETYRQFWEKLNRGEFQAAQFSRFGKDGKPVWMEASYNPVSGRDGKPIKVINYATDVTRERMQLVDMKGVLAALDKSQAMIEFDLDGTILNANANYLRMMGYEMEEIRGKHHSIFVDPAYRDSGGYRQFWQMLRCGLFRAEQFKRLAKGGKAVWIEASYNPILDAKGRPVKVVKFATDVSDHPNPARGRGVPA